MVEVANDRTNGTDSDHRSVGQKLADEASLLLGSASWIPHGVKEGFKDMYEHPVHAAEVLGLSVAAGALSTNPYGRMALYGLSALGVGAMVAPDAYAVWKNADSLSLAQEDLGNKLGTTLAYAPIAAAGGYAGMRAAQADWAGIYSRFGSAASDTPAQLSGEGAQNVFRASGEELIDAKKQLYNVNFDKITEAGGRTVPTLENPAGESAPQGNWVATRLDPSGQPVVENGMTNQWPVTDKTILKTYQTTPDQLQSATNFTAPTKVDAPPVKMAPLYGNTNLETPWGTMSTPKAGAVDRVLGALQQRPLGWLANYDYNAATGEPGSSFALITARSFGQTYETLPQALVTSEAIDFTPLTGAMIYGASEGDRWAKQAH